MEKIAKDLPKRLSLDSDNIRHITLLIAIIALFVIFSFNAHGFFSVATVMNISRQAAALALVSIAMTMIMISGGIDLSVGSVIAFSGAVAALVMQNIGGSSLVVALIGFAASLAAALVFGLINGFAVGYLKIAPFITTLTTMALARGLTLTITDSARVIVDNDFYNAMGQMNICSVPLSLALVILAYVGAALLLSKTVFGRYTYAVGDNLVASDASGINTKFHKLAVYAVASVFVALATLVIVGRARSAQPLAGIGMEFTVITAVVLGGTSLMGGRGSLKGTFLGVVLVSVIFTGLSMMALPPFMTYMVRGLLILFAVLSGHLITKKRTPRKVPAVSAAPAEDTSTKAEAVDVHALIKGERQTVLTLRGISKSFPGVQALDDVSLCVKRGTVHALCGENGAGKSTLMKILSGVYQKDAGEILIDGLPVEIKSPVDSERIGISVIYQELANISELNVSQNINLGKEIPSNLPLLLGEKKMHEKTEELLNRFRLNVSPTTKIKNLTIGQQQLVEIAKAYGSNAWVIVMDEPTSSITEKDKEVLFEIIDELKRNNMAIVYITHRMSEIFEIADEITILRDGKHVVTGLSSEFDESRVIRNMVGRELSDIFNREGGQAGEVVLRVENLQRDGVFEPISFEVKSGEVLGFSGLIGAGRSEIMRCICGLDQADGGSIYLGGEQLNIKHTRSAIDAGIVMVSENRREEGIIPHSTVRENISIASLAEISSFGWVDRKRDVSITRENISALDIKTSSTEQMIMNLSGGNQQKACLAKWLNCNPKVIILDEPTRGIDVGAKAEVHKLIDQLTKQGLAVILISSELPEIIGASDRIIVLYEGKMMREFDNDNVTQEMLMQSATGLEV
ncbi:MAG: ATP-binding cassette domain-containing protein [Oscillospiraceae bacterium]|nr:ATP-binding cassette domain-containing protein [Oscillospiraceae bacterium]